MKDVVDQWLGRGCGVGLTVVLGAAVEVVLKLKLLISAKYENYFLTVRQWMLSAPVLIYNSHGNRFNKKSQIRNATRLLTCWWWRLSEPFWNKSKLINKCIQGCGVNLRRRGRCC